MNEEISIREIKEMSDTSNSPFAMAILDDKCEIAMYGPYHDGFARDFSHIPLYTKPQLKPLSDEEITEIAEKTLGHSMGLLNWMGFAKAILRKAWD